MVSVGLVIHCLVTLRLFRCHRVCVMRLQVCKHGLFQLSSSAWVMTTRGCRETRSVASSQIVLDTCSRNRSKDLWSLWVGEAECFF